MNKLPHIISIIAFIGGLVFAQQYFSKNKLPAGKQTPIAGKEFGGEFTLQREGGKPVSLSDFRDNVVVLYFGFASCPDVCPTSLAIIGSAMKSLSAEEVADVKGLFISLDPERDTDENLKQYAEYFHENFSGITGTLEQVERVARRYGTYFIKVAGSSESSYTIDHTSATFIIGRDGKFVVSKAHGTPAEEITEAIRSAL